MTPLQRVRATGEDGRVVFDAEAWHLDAWVSSGLWTTSVPPREVLTLQAVDDAGDPVGDPWEWSPSPIAGRIEVPA